MTGGNVRSRIKKAYRMKALELHPDRNYGSVEEATRLFAEVQSAYDVLSDPQERAWYDSHQSAILRNESKPSHAQFAHNVRVTTAEDIMNLFINFKSPLDFSDSATGFFGRLRSTFDMLAREEALACEWEGSDPVSYPSFGHASDDHEQVVRPFYNVWTNFATCKSFSWKDIYRPSDAPDRRVRRLMEKENRRLREGGIHDLNDAVRSLVAFARKRDPRYQFNTRSEAERQRVSREAALAQAARSRAANLARAAAFQQIPNWSKSTELSEPNITDEEQEIVDDEVECVVCKKIFKSENQYKAHEKSKKHIKAVQHVRREMQMEDRALNLANNQTNAVVSSTVLTNSGVADRVEVVIPADVENDLDLRSITNSLVDSEEPQISVKIASHDTTGSSVSSHEEVVLSRSSNSMLSILDDENDPVDIVETRHTSEIQIQPSTVTTVSCSDNLPTTTPSKLISQEKPNAAQTKVGKAKERRVRKTLQNTAAISNHTNVRCY